MRKCKVSRVLKDLRKAAVSLIQLNNCRQRDTLFLKLYSGFSDANKVVEVSWEHQDQKESGTAMQLAVATLA